VTRPGLKRSTGFMEHAVSFHRRRWNVQRARREHRAQVARPALRRAPDCGLRDGPAPDILTQPRTLPPFEQRDDVMTAPNIDPRELELQPVERAPTIPAAWYTEPAFHELGS